jgi:predicted hydrocarbon binding protein
MSESEKMVPVSQAVRMLTTGMEWEAGIFFEAFKILSKRLGRDEARKILGKVMYNAGYKLGSEARQLVDKSGPRGMAEAWDIIYGAGTEEAELVDDDNFVISHSACAAYFLFKRWGMSADDIKFVGEAYCAADIGHAEGFGGDLNFQHSHRMMRGDDKCRYVFSKNELKPCAGALDKRNIIDEDN